MSIKQDIRAAKARVQQLIKQRIAAPRIAKILQCEFKEVFYVHNNVVYMNIKKGGNTLKICL